MNRYEEIREYVNDLIQDLENLKFYKLKVLGLFSILDSFAQNYFKYNDKKSNKEIFCGFVIRFADKEKYVYLNEIDPVTLFYEKNGKCRIDGLSDANIYTPISKEIKKMRINQNNDERHTYIQLIYACRSKIVHEQQSAGIVKVETENENYNMPIYMDFTSYWKLIFPYIFLKELSLNCIYNYIEYQKEKGVDPFDSNYNRKSFYTFYDNNKKI